MNEILPINLNYLYMPDKDYKQADFVLQVTGRYVKNALMSFLKGSSSGMTAGHNGFAFIQCILKPFKEELQAIRIDQTSEPTARTAFAAFRLPSCYRIRLVPISNTFSAGRKFSQNMKTDKILKLFYNLK